MKTGGPAMFITVKHDLALVRGYESERGVRMISTDPPQWSPGGRGWVIAAAQVPDLIAYAQVHHLLVVVSDITDETAVSA